MTVPMSKEEYISALEKMKNSPPDILGILGVIGVTGLGTAAGIAASGTIAGALGATTLLESTTLAALLGGIFVTTTPVGWIVGSAFAAGTLAFGTGWLIKSGARSDTIREMNINDLKDRLLQLQSESERAQVTDDKIRKLIEALQLLVKNDRMLPNLNFRKFVHRFVPEKTPYHIICVKITTCSRNLRLTYA